MNIPYQTLAIDGDPTPWVISEPTDSKEWCVLRLQGWESTIGGHYEAIVRLASASNIPFAMLDYAGHGTHPTPLANTSREQQHIEVVALYNELKTRGYKQIIALGNSFGSYMAALLCAKRDVAALVLRAPAIYDDAEFSLLQKDRDDTAYQKFKESIFVDSPLSALQAIKHYDKTVYVFEHEIDSVIPKNIPQAYFQSAKRGNYILIPATDHAPVLMPEPQKHYAYIESTIVSVLELVQLEATLQT